MNTRLLNDVCVALVIAIGAAAATTHAQTQMDRDPPRIPASTHNLLLDASVSGNLESFGKGLRGAPGDLIYDVASQRFRQPSQWHEYGVGFSQDLGVVPEAEAAFWLAQWPAPVSANFIVLSGVYPNQPQPNTAWKIELRHQDQWITHARGIGGWYDRGLHVWGGPAHVPVEFDALRVSLFSRDNQTPLHSIHFRGEERLSWLVAHAFADPGDYSVGLTLSDGRHTVTLREAVQVIVPLQVDLEALTGQVMAGQPFHLTARSGSRAISTPGILSDAISSTSCPRTTRRSTTRAACRPSSASVWTWAG